MKRFSIIITFILISVSLLTLKAEKNMKLEKMLSDRIENGKELNFYELVDEYEKQWEGIPYEERGGWKQFQRWKYFYERRINPDGTFTDPGKLYNEAKKIEKMYDIDRVQNTTWEFVGPSDDPEPNNVSTGIGRLNCLRFHPDNEQEIWVGAAAGGIWRSTTGGDNWVKMSPNNEFQTLGITDIAIAPSSPNIIYAATGDAFGARSTGYDTYSAGVIKSTDAGNTWSKTDLRYDISQVQLIGRVLVHPDDENVVFAATSQGIYKSEDGGDSWIRKPTPNYYFIDMEFKADDPSIIIASTYTFNQGRGFIFRSIDNGESWEQVAQINGAKRIAITISHADPNFMYAISGFWQDDNFNSFEFSSDAGETWTTTSSRNQGAPNILGRDEDYDDEGQAWYDLSIAANPTNIEELYTGGIDIWKTSALGTSFEPVSHNRARFNRPFVHADIHDLQYTSDGSKIYAATDGGVALSTDNGESWSSLNENLEITQYYKIDVYNKDESFLVGGTQDNGTSRLLNGEWSIIMEGDGMDCYIDPNDNRNVLASVYYGSFQRSTNYGEDFRYAFSTFDTDEAADWTAPLAYSESNPNLVIIGHSNVYRSTSGGNVPWVRISDFGNNTPLVALAIAPSNPNYIYAASRVILRVTSNSGADGWSRIFPPSGFGGIITGITVDQNNPERIWVSIGQFNRESKVWEYDGENWFNRSGNLPNIPINCIAYQNNSPDRLYIGTDLGVWYSDYNSGFWEPYGSGIPGTIVADIDLHYQSNQIYVGTHGRGIWRAPLIQCNLPQPEIEVIGDTDLCQGETVTLRYNGDVENFAWSTGSTEREIEVGASGEYVLIVDDGDGCTAKSAPIIINVTEFDPVEISFEGFGAFCEDINSEVELIASPGFETYQWYKDGTEIPNATNDVLTTTETGNYQVMAITEEGCPSESPAYEVINASLPEPPELVQWKGTNISVDDIWTSYEWYKDGQRLFLESEHIISDIDDSWVGSEVYVIVTDDKGCPVESNTITVYATSVNNEFEKEVASISPNPSDGIFTLDLRTGTNKPVDITVTNILGQEIYTKKNLVQFGTLNLDIDISNEAEGVYILNVTSEGFTWSTKLIKE
jgi:photosystem II stability/assembly factor-like uncharacterized protein